MSETSSNWDGDYQHLFFLDNRTLFSFFNYSLFSGKPVIHARPVLAPGLGWVYPNWSKSEISPQLPNQQVWTWTCDIILANETNEGGVHQKISSPWKRSPLLLGIVSGYDAWKWYNHLAASVELNLTLKLAAQKDGENPSPWWYCWLLIF